MPHWQPRDSTSLSDTEYQEYILDGVSRTFALTIPRLPTPLRTKVGNAYLLCRIADTIEDDPELEPGAKERFAKDLVAALDGAVEANALASDLARALSPRTRDAERDLIDNLTRVVRLSRTFPSSTRASVVQCLEKMTAGMTEFQRNATPYGLAGVPEVERYCYCVAGVVGELLTDLFAEQVGPVARRRGELRPLAVSFGAGLQWTNILKDVWVDRDRGACWLPRALFTRHGADLEAFGRGSRDPRLGAVLTEMIAIAHGHLRRALRFILGIPARERGVRAFCVDTLGLALLTLRKLHHRPEFLSGATVKISRRAVWLALRASPSVAASDRALVWFFDRLARGLPAPVAELQPVAAASESRLPAVR